MSHKIWKEDWKNTIPNRRWDLELGHFNQSVYREDDGFYSVYLREVHIATLDRAMIKAQEYAIKEYQDFRILIEKRIAKLS